MLGNGEQHQFERPILEEESYASNDSFDGLKRERMTHFLYKWLLRKGQYIIDKVVLFVWPISTRHLLPGSVEFQTFYLEGSAFRL